VNHLLPALTLRIAGIWKKPDEINRAALWISRGAVILIFYVGQVLLADHFLGRAEAGYYALGLPLSGLYLWRYAWLLRHRSRVLALHARAPRRAARARERRQEFVRQLNTARQAYIEALELAH
jgi:chromatin segregation and condensation protein Rec8/ScpA/Scc1 (kleisin family)